MKRQGALHGPDFSYIQSVFWRWLGRGCSVRGSTVALATRAEEKAEGARLKSLLPGPYRTLSHTRGSRGHVALALSWKRPIGVDVEHVERPVSPAAKARIGHSGIPEGLTALSLWVIQEACFKANPKNAGTIVLSYRVIRYDARARTGEVQFESSGKSLRFSFRLIQSRGWWIAGAILKN